MADEKDMKAARKAYETMCAMFDEKDLRYTKDDEELSVECTMRGDGLPVSMDIQVDADRDLVMLISLLPFKIPSDKMLDMAIAISALNYSFVNGSFDYDFRREKIYFRMTMSYRNSRLSEDAFFYMLICSAKTIDEHSEKLMMLAKNLYSLTDFLKDLKK